MPLLRGKHNCRDLPPIIRLPSMGGAAETEKAVFRGISANLKRFDRPCAGLGQAMGNISGQVEAEMIGSVRWRKEARVAGILRKEAVTEVGADFIIGLPDRGANGRADAPAHRPQFFHRFQRGFQASARALSAMDQMIDELINRTGRVGL